MNHNNTSSIYHCPFNKTSHTSRPSLTNQPSHIPHPIPSHTHPTPPSFTIPCHASSSLAITHHHTSLPPSLIHYHPSILPNHPHPCLATFTPPSPTYAGHMQALYKPYAGLIQALRRPYAHKPYAGLIQALCSLMQALCPRSFYTGDIRLL